MFPGLFCIHECWNLWPAEQRLGPYTTTPVATGWEGVIHEVWLRTVTDMLRSQPSVSLIPSTYLREHRKLCKINSINNKGLVLLGFLFLNFVIFSCKEQEAKEPGLEFCHFQHTLRMRVESSIRTKLTTSS